MKFNTLYHIDADTKRIALPLADWEKLDADIPTYFYQPSLACYGLDPWRIVDQVDKLTDNGVDLWFENGTMPSLKYDSLNLHKLFLYVAVKDLPEEMLNDTKALKQTKEPAPLTKSEEYALIRQNRAIYDSAIQCVDAMYFAGVDKFNIDEHLAAVKAKFLELKE